MKRKNKIPSFSSEDAERAFWAKHDSTDFIDWSKAKRATFPNLKPTVKSISIRLPQSMISELKLLANKKDIPYQSLMKMYLSTMIDRELHPKRDRVKGAASILS